MQNHTMRLLFTKEWMTTSGHQNSLRTAQDQILNYHLWAGTIVRQINLNTDIGWTCTKTLPKRMAGSLEGRSVMYFLLISSRKLNCWDSALGTLKFQQINKSTSSVRIYRKTMETNWGKAISSQFVLKYGFMNLYHCVCYCQLFAL